MKRKNTETNLLKLYIAEALILLLEKDKFSDLTIKEITKKAGVNRSTYYRNFNSKEDIIVFFYASILDKCIPVEPLPKLEEHLLHSFHQFLSYKKELLYLHKNNLSYLLLEALNSYFIQNHTKKKIDFEKEFELSYHTGGIFNTFLLWFDYGMEQDPNILVKKSIQLLPEKFEPFLFKTVKREI